MSLLGIDIGTTGCKVVLFARQGEPLAAAYREYNIERPEPGWAELDARATWAIIQAAIRAVTAHPAAQDIRALAVSSLGEAVVPVSADRRILGPSLLNFDARGEEFLDPLRAVLDNAQLYPINGNTLGNHYTLTKLKWIQKYQPALYEQTAYFLHWSAFVAFMLGTAPVVDYSLANRTLLFDLGRGTWSPDLLARTGIDKTKLPPAVPSGTWIGEVSADAARELGLPAGAKIVSGAHDQCANATGCGVIDPGSAVCGMGTYLCITPVFTARAPAEAMMRLGLNTEHHAAPDRFVSFIYNQGGQIVKWFRDTFAAAEHHQAQAAGQDIYPALFAELPTAPSPVIVLPHFTATGPPEFVSDSCGVIAGLHADTRRGDILKGIIEGTTYYLKAIIDDLPATGIQITDYRAVGGGSKSDVWIQTCTDILGQPFTRPAITEAGALGAAIMAGVGCGDFASYEDGVAAMVRLERRFEPDADQHRRYAERYDQYRPLWPLLRGYLREL
jgi:xylulokinase